MAIFKRPFIPQTVFKLRYQDFGTSPWKFQKWVNVTETGYHTFLCAFFQDFPRSKLRFSRAVICGKNALGV